MVTAEIQKSFFKHIIGPRGGLFALGVFIGMFIMHIYMTEYVYKAQINQLTAQTESLKSDVKELKAENARLNTKLQEIAFRSMPFE